MHRNPQEVSIMIRKKKNYVRPRKIFERVRIDEENKLVESYGLKNKKEIWKSQAKINYFRSRAKALANQPLEEQELFFKKLQSIGLKVTSSAEVLGLKVENWLARRLPTIVKDKKLAHTAKQARQMVVHKNVLIDGKVVNTPSYIVSVSEEKLITVKVKAKKPVAKTPEKADEQAEENPNEEPAISDAPEEVKADEESKPTEENK